MLIKGDTLLFTGDSITDTGRVRDDATAQENADGWGYANILKAMLLHDYANLGLTIYNRGISGNRIVDLYARAKEDCYNLRPSVVSVLIGINDLWAEFKRGTGVEITKFDRVYDMMLAELRERLPNVRIVLMEPFSLPGGLPDVDDYEDWRRQLSARQVIVHDLANSYNAIFVPLQPAFDAACRLAPDTYWLYDGVHPTAPGHMLIANAWQQAWRQAVLKESVLS